MGTFFGFRLEEEFDEGFDDACADCSDCECGPDDCDGFSGCYDDEDCDCSAVADKNDIGRWDKKICAGRKCWDCILRDNGCLRD